jgi:radical SAM protein with 4Fe4S-binding SPASM domain
MGETRNLLRKFTWRKAQNAWRIYRSYQKSQKTGVPDIKGLPIALAFEPTTSCNLRCPECPSGLRSFTRPTGMLQEDIFRKVIDELHSTLFYLTFYFQGEPYLHPQFLDMVQYAAQKGIYTSTSTNAHYLTEKNALKTIESGLDRLIISLDGTTQETYQSYRIGGKLDKVIEGTKRLVALKKELKSRTPHLIFQFLVVKPNEHQIPDAYRLAKELGVDEVKLKTAQIYDYEHGSELMPTIDKYSRYRLGDDGKYHIKNGLANHCWKMWHSCVITWDGMVVPCAFDKDAHYRLGNVGDMSFAEVWQSEPYRQFRATLLRSRSEIEMCKNCTEGTKVWA